VRLVTYSRGRLPARLGVAIGPWNSWEAIVDLQGLDRSLPTDAMTFVDSAGGLAGGIWSRTVKAVRRAEASLRRTWPRYAYRPRKVKLDAPIRPRILRDFIAFRGHIARTRAARGEKVPPEWDKVPAYYNGNAGNVIGTNATVPFPRNVIRDGDGWKTDPTQKLDYEAEIGYVLGRGGSDVPAERATGYLFGVTIFNDFSMRDLQTTVGKVGMGPAAGKDWTNALGPCIVTRDEFGALKDQRIVVRVNGSERLTGRFDDLVHRNAWVAAGERASWTFDDLVGFLSRIQTIRPGEVWGSGTIPGGCEFEKGESAAYLEPGDQVEIEVEGIGILSNPIGAKP
jgi:2-keto-4-pentenoate hydratase/2-oxohepta-3-ene-1,7-dioic acid hydratase in catechol pathway